MKRRTMIRGMAGAGAFAAAAPAMRLFAEPPENFRFVSLYMNGGWDVLLGFDARPPDARYDELDVGTSLLAPEYRTPLEVELGGRSVLWGRPTESLTLPGASGEAPHSSLLTLFRSVNMNTVAHAAGRAYVNTFRSPVGVVPRGSSFGTVMSTAGALSEELVLPNVSIAMPTFNEAYEADYTGVGVALSTNIVDLLSPSRGSRLDDATEALLAQAQDAAGSCVSRAYRGTRPEETLRGSRERVRRLLEGNVGALFDVRADSPEGQALRDRFGLSMDQARNARHPSTVGAIVGQLLSTGLSRSVSATLQVGLDTHNQNWTTDQAPRLQAAFEGLSALLWDLRADDPNLERTVVTIHSEFARTPRINGTSGRDHWFSNTIAVFGGPLRRGVLGETVESTLNLQRTNLSTGLPDSGGEMLRPEMIAATIAEAIGIDGSAFRAPSLQAWIEGGAR
ncbi:MAG: DUF1501 domain-containing protein [Myxococcota bacterium]